MSFKELCSPELASPAIRRNYEGMIGDGHPGYRLRRGDPLEFTSLSLESSDDIKEFMVGDAFRAHDLRPCCFWELLWAIHAIAAIPGATRRIAHPASLGAPIERNVGGREFCFMANVDFASPAVRTIADTEVGRKTNPLSFIGLPKSAPMPVTRRLLAAA